MADMPVQAQTSVPVSAPGSEVARQRAWLAATPEQRITQAERLGEQGAEAFAAKKGYTPLLRKSDKGLTQGFDQVYRAKDGSIIVIEAKGGTSALGRAYGCTQGTPEWAVKAAFRVMKSSKATAAEREAARLVLAAARKGKLTVQVVRTRHIFGEPLAAVLESSLKSGKAEARAAQALTEAASATKAGRTTNAVSKTVASTGKLGKVGKAAGGVGVAVDGALRIHRAIETEKKFKSGSMSNQERVTAHAKNAAGMAGGMSGAYAGGKSGAATGAAIGACFGGVGAPFGAAVGGVIGMVGGYIGGEYLGESFVGAVCWFWK